MAFELLPAIDLAGGRLGVLTAEGPRPIEAFGGDPLAAASAFRDAGARWIHVVDMDLAFRGSLDNAGIIREIAMLPDIRVQASGAVRTRAVADALLELGAARIVVSSAALADPAAMTELVEWIRPEELLFGLEVGDGRVRSRGTVDVDLDLDATLARLREAGVGGLLVTAVSRVGTRGGPDLALVRRVAAGDVAIVAAGGIRSVEDLAALRDAGAAGAVVGRAAVEGSLDLAAAIAWAGAPA